MDRRRQAILRISPAIDQCADWSPDPQRLHARTNLFDEARSIETRDIGRAWRWRIKPAPLLDIRPIDACRDHPDQHLAGTGTGPLPFDNPENLRTTRPFDLNNFHRLVSAVVSIGQADQTRRIVGHHGPHLGLSETECEAELDGLPHAFDRRRIVHLPEVGADRGMGDAGSQDVLL